MNYLQKYLYVITNENAYVYVKQYNYTYVYYKAAILFSMEFNEVYSNKINMFTTMLLCHYVGWHQMGILHQQLSHI